MNKKIRGLLISTIILSMLSIPTADIVEVVAEELATSNSATITSSVEESTEESTKVEENTINSESTDSKVIQESIKESHFDENQNIKKEPTSDSVDKEPTSDSVDKEKSFTWGEVPVTFAKETGTLAIAGGEFKYSPSPISELCTSNGINPQDVKKIHLLANLTMVGSMARIFYNLKELTEFEGLANLNVSKVTNMEWMFNGCSSLTNLDLSSFDTSKVTKMNDMFRDCRSLTNLDLSGFNTSKVTRMNTMFRNCSSLTSLDLSSFNTSEVTNMEWMFNGCSSLTNLDLSSFDTSKVTNMNDMFRDCSSLTNLDLSGFNTSKVTRMDTMFRNCSSLTSLDLSSFNTSEVTNMSGMFYEISLTNLDLSSFDTSKVTNMGGMFGECSSLTNLDLSGFNTSKVTNMSVMFLNCSSLTNLDLSGFDTSKVTKMSDMFSWCRSLTNLDLSSFNTSEVTDMERMFSWCRSLTNLDLSSFNTSEVTNMADMFYECFDLKELTLGEKFKIVMFPNLPTIIQTQEYTGKWQNVGTGSKEKPNGTHIWTSVEFMTNYSGETDADTYVWQPVVKAAGELILDSDKKVVNAGEKVAWKANIKNTGEGSLTSINFKKTAQWSNELAAPTELIVSVEGETTKTIPITTEQFQNGINLGLNIPEGKTLSIQFNTVVTGLANQVLNAEIEVTSNLKTPLKSNKLVRVSDKDQGTEEIDNTGFISVPNFDFGTIKISDKEKQYGLKKDTNYYNDGQNNPNVRFKDTDTATGKKWTLQATMSLFESANDVLPGTTKITFENAELNEIQDFGKTSENLKLLNTQNFSVSADNTATNITNLASGQGAYHLNLPFEKVKLTIPENVGKANETYNATITWDFTAGP